MMLRELGHEIHGISLDPLPNGIFEKASVKELCKSDLRIDIRNKEALDAACQDTQPNFVFHLAAQPLVLKSYDEVYETYSTNVSGTLNVLDASQKSKSLRGVIVVTTDKVYLNHEEQRAFVESDALGGHDPYSSSKALADLLSQDWSRHHPDIPIGIARAGNVIGGGDVSPNRLVPDLINAIQTSKIPSIRNPKAVRPWQHVMDCLNGYIALMDHVVEGNSGAFNFGPKNGDFHTVEEVTTHTLNFFNESEWAQDSDKKGKESGFLTLDSTKSQRVLDWENKLSFEQGLDWTLDWHKALFNGLNVKDFTISQIKNFFSLT